MSLEECKTLIRRSACIGSLNVQNLTVTNSIEPAPCATYPLQIDDDFCLDFVPGFCGSIHQYIRGSWGIYRSPGMTEVTVGLPGDGSAPGANYASVAEALNNAGNTNCRFIRICDNVQEIGPLILPGPVLIYVDPGVTYTINGGFVTNFDLVLIGAISQPSSRIIFSGSQALVSGNGHLRLHHLHLINLTANQPLVTVPQIGLSDLTYEQGQGIFLDDTLQAQSGIVTGLRLIGDGNSPVSWVCNQSNLQVSDVVVSGGFANLIFDVSSASSTWEQLRFSVDANGTVQLSSCTINHIKDVQSNLEIVVSDNVSMNLVRNIRLLSLNGSRIHIDNVTTTSIDTTNIGVSCKLHEITTSLLVNNSCLLNTDNEWTGYLINSSTPITITGSGGTITNLSVPSTDVNLTTLLNSSLVQTKTSGSLTLTNCQRITMQGVDCDLFLITTTRDPVDYRPVDDITVSGLRSASTVAVLNTNVTKLIGVEASEDIVYRAAGRAELSDFNTRGSLSLACTTFGNAPPILDQVVSLGDQEVFVNNGFVLLDLIIGDVDVIGESGGRITVSDVIVDRCYGTALNRNRGSIRMTNVTLLDGDTAGSFIFQAPYNGWTNADSRFVVGFGNHGFYTNVEVQLGDVLIGGAQLQNQNFQNLRVFDGDVFFGRGAGNLVMNSQIDGLYALRNGHDFIVRGQHLRVNDVNIASTPQGAGDMRPGNFIIHNNSQYCSVSNVTLVASDFIVETNSSNNTISDVVILGGARALADGVTNPQLFEILGNNILLTNITLGRSFYRPTNTLTDFAFGNGVNGAYRVTFGNNNNRDIQVTNFILWPRRGQTNIATIGDISGPLGTPQTISINATMSKFENFRVWFTPESTTIEAGDPLIAHPNPQVDLDVEDCDFNNFSVGFNGELATAITPRFGSLVLNNCTNCRFTNTFISDNLLVQNTSGLLLFSNSTFGSVNDNSATGDNTYNACRIITQTANSSQIPKVATTIVSGCRDFSTPLTVTLPGVRTTSANV